MNDTRQLLLDGARSCLRERGLAGTSSRRITAVAGVNLAAITYHFGSKEQLVGEALLGSLRAWLAPALEVLQSDLDPMVRTTQAVAALVSTFEEMRDEAPTYLEAMVQAPRMTSLHQGVISLWTELREGLAAQIDALKREQRLPLWVESASMAALLIATANGLVLQVTLDPTGPPLSAMAAQFARLLLAAGS